MRLVQLQLPPVDVGAEAEVGGEDEQDEGDDAGCYGAGARRVARSRVVRGACVAADDACFGDNGAGGVGRCDGVCLGLTGCQWT